MKTILVNTIYSCLHNCLLLLITVWKKSCVMLKYDANKTILLHYHARSRFCIDWEAAWNVVTSSARFPVCFYALVTATSDRWANKLIHLSLYPRSIRKQSRWTSLLHCHNFVLILSFSFVSLISMLIPIEIVFSCIL